MSSYVIHRNGKITTVKNLGWLLRHWSRVESLGFNYQPKETVDGQLIAKMKDGATYFSDFVATLMLIVFFFLLLIFVMVGNISRE